MIFFIRNDAQFVIEVVNFFGMGGCSRKYEAKVKKLFKQCGEERIATLRKAAESIDNPGTPKELYAVSRAYVWAGATCRKQAIDALERYISVGAFWDGLPSGKIDMGTYIVDQKKANIASVYSDLGKAYEGEYMFEQALACYHEASKIVPEFMHNYIFQGKVLIKQGKIEEAISLLEKAKLGGKIPKSDLHAVDVHISKFKEKKASGYKYRPRKSLKTDTD